MTIRTTHQYAREMMPPVYDVEIVSRTPERITLSKIEDAAAILSTLLANKPVEVFAILMLDNQLQVMGTAEVQRGGRNKVYISPADVFRPAVAIGASSIIIAHNHPSGNPMPSPEDMQVTTKLAKAGLLLGIEVLDHIITGTHGAYTSMKKDGVMK